MTDKYPIGEMNVDAIYSQPAQVMYKGNPVIEALPEIMSVESIYDHLLLTIPFDESERRLPTYERAECISALYQVFQPFSLHIDLAQKISRAIRSGYVRRNPLTADYRKALNQLGDCVQKKDWEFSQFTFTNTGTPGFSVLGSSGIGKSCSIQRVLSQYPQTITHSEYAGIPFYYNQIVWMKLDCPHDGSIKGLCTNFFQEFDRVTGDNTFYKFASSTRATTDTMIPQMALIALRHIPSIVRAKKVVIAGDHKQLRPSNLGAGRIELDEELLEEDTEIAAALEEESLLDLARFKYQDVLLNFHYRSQYEELIAFSNYAFYKGRLYVSPNTKKPEKQPIEFICVDNAQWINRANMQEARKIISLLKQFFKERTGAETIGIITFNSTQRDLIDDLIDEESAKDPSFASSVKAEISRKENGEDIGLFVKNIESVQGDERDVIMFSIGYARNESGRLVRNYGWLNQKGGENRLNVAISRAKKKIYIVTSFDPSELQVEDAKNDGPRILKKYLQYAQAVSNGDNEGAKQILLSFGDAEDNGSVTFDSDFENQVYDALVEKGYKVETQVGIGGYSIDLAIKRDGQYILGIECDGKLYHSSKSARERDYHRQKYLESRGWRIHRIWSTNWWRNPKSEIQKICTLVDSL